MTERFLEADHAIGASRLSPRRESLALMLVFVPCFLVLISVAILGQLVGLHWKGWLPGAENMSNVFSGTKAAVYTLLSHIS
jgi:light-harvesting complex 1 beta chain